jgi:Tfp pilus assembly protein PilF
MPLVKLWVMLQPDASPAYEMLGWAYATQGDMESAAHNLRQALALDPENELAGRLLRQINRG